MNDRASLEWVEAVRRTDPLANDPDEGGTAAHLVGAHAILLARLQPTEHAAVESRHRRRRLLVLASVTAALTAASTIVIPALGGRPGNDVTGGLIVGTAYASSSGLECGQGYGQRIPPRQGNPRPWPAMLPSGVTVDQVFARTSTITGWCTQPSLVAAQTDNSGLITGTVRIVGPARNIVVHQSDATDDTVGGLKAVAFPSSPATGPDAFHSWLITDSTGDQWYASVAGYSEARSRELLSAATLHSPSITWNEKQAPALKVLWLRTGAPYATSRTEQNWYLRITIHGQPQDLGARDGDVLAGGGVNSRYINVAGKRMNVAYEDGQPVRVTAQILPGVIMSAQVQSNLDEVTGLLASMTSLAADDERLVKFALPEDYSSRQHA